MGIKVGGRHPYCTVYLLWLISLEIEKHTEMRLATNCPAELPLFWHQGSHRQILSKGVCCWHHPGRGAQADWWSANRWECNGGGGGVSHREHRRLCFYHVLVSITQAFYFTLTVSSCSDASVILTNALLKRQIFLKLFYSSTFLHYNYLIFT